MNDAYSDFLATERTTEIIATCQRAIGILGTIAALAVFILLWKSQRKPYFLAIITTSICDLISVGLTGFGYRVTDPSLAHHFMRASDIVWIFAGLSGILGFAWWFYDLAKQKNTQPAG